MANDSNVSRTIRLKNRRGAMMVVAAISMVGLLGLVAIATDIGAGNRQRRIAQLAADAGAIGGGRQIERKLDSASVVAFALSSVVKNGFTAAETTVNYPPSAAAAAKFRNTNYVEVLIGRKSATLFGRIFGNDSIPVQARAVAGLSTQNQNCVYNLASGATGIDWPGKFTTNCGVVTNGSADFKKGADAPYVAAVGSISNGPSGKSYPGSPPVFDPYAYLTAPAETSCDFTNKQVNSNETLNPGVYCGGITIKKNTLATLNAGTYIIRGGGLTGGEIDGTAGVTIINTNGPGNDQSTYRPVTFGNSCSVLVNAPSSGTYKGIAFFTPSVVPAAASASDQVNDFCGKGTNNKCEEADVDVRGVIYMPNQTVSVGNSNGKLSVAGQLISKFLTASNGGAEMCMFLNKSGSTILNRLTLVE